MIMCSTLSIDSPIPITAANAVDLKLSTDNKNGLSDNNIQDFNVQSLTSKVQDIISIGSRYNI